MQKFTVNYDLLKKYSGKYLDYNEVKDKLVKVAFDLYKLEDDKAARLWEVNKADDGNYIVALYSEDQDIEKKSNWDVQINKAANNVNFYYKGEYVTKLSEKQLGIKLEDANSLPEKLSSNKNLVNALLKNADVKTKNNLVSKYPELA